jgi:hypothetical protein
MNLLDTNVISETMRERPHSAVSEWLDAQPRNELWMASVVVAELLAGIETMSPGRKQLALREAVEDMVLDDFYGQIFPFNVPAARRYAQILAARQKMGHPIREMDAQIAAIACVHGATLVTRDVDDFAGCNLTVVNPWEKQAQP